jgi:hypothetical protein
VRFGSEGVIVGILLACTSAATTAQTLTVKRADAAYHPTHKFDPANLMAPAHFKTTSSGQYVVVEGYIDCLGSGWPEKDGDYHFELQSTNAKRGPGVSSNGLVCKNDPTTYRKVRVYGWLRFGTEKTNHSGIHVYDLGGGQTITGHWEIHPVEKVIYIDASPLFQIGPTGKYVPAVSAKRYSLNDTNFEVQSPSNYGALRGTVKTINLSENNSGDCDVKLEVNTTNYTATIPQYYVKNFDPITHTVTFVHTPNFALIHYSLKPSDSTQHTFYGLRNWTFDKGKPTPALQPVEVIK